MVGQRDVDVVVAGGGLAGLTAAAVAAGAGRSVLVLDGRPGGNRAATDEVGRFRFNRGPHALYREGAGRAVLARLGVTVSGGKPPQAGLLGRRGDEVGLLPAGPGSLVRSRLVSRRGKLRLARLLTGARRWRPEALADRTAATWFDDLGLDGDERGIVEMLARTTTYVADLDRVSADLAARQMQMGLGGGVDYLDGGWSSLLDGLARAGGRAGVERSAAMAATAMPESGRVRVTLAGDGGERTVLARAVVVAAGTPDACAAVLPEAPAAWQALGPPATTSCLDLGLAAEPQTAVLFGIDRPLYLSRHDPPAELAPPGASVVHAMRYLRADEAPSAAESRAELEQHCRLAGIEPDEAEQVRYLHRMVACGAIPVPATGGLAGRAGVTSAGLDGVFVAGDWLGSQGHLGDAALATGEEAGRLAAAHAAGGGRAAGRSARLAAHG
jgi:phytoene dehydrogenase-like protein